MLAAQSAVGLCYALQLLDLPDQDRISLLRFIGQIEKLTSTAPLCGSVLDFVRETRTGERKRRLRYENIGRALIGLSRTAQLLESQLSWHDRNALYGYCLSLMSLAEEHDATLGSSSLELVIVVFTGAADPQDDPDYLAQEIALQAEHGINPCGAEHWDPEWDEK